MNKAGSLKEITEKVQAIKRAGIHVGAWFMLGFPGETKRDMKETVDYAFSICADVIRFTIVFPLPGAGIYGYLKEKYELKSIDWSTFNISQSTYPMSELSSKKLTRLLKKIRLRIRIEENLKGVAHFLGRK
jgi:anaerobic magnesium-protoporphyrin IX monomethyl ester cyclase